MTLRPYPDRDVPNLTFQAKDERYPRRRRIDRRIRILQATILNGKRMACENFLAREYISRLSNATYRTIQHRTNRASLDASRTKRLNGQNQRASIQSKETVMTLVIRPLQRSVCMRKGCHAKAFLCGYSSLADHAIAYSSKRSMHLVVGRHESGS